MQDILEEKNGDESWVHYLPLIRVGRYDDASSDIKKSWYILLSRFLKYLCKDWNPAVTMTKSSDYTDAVRASDEAFMVALIQRNRERWVSGVQEEDKTKKKKTNWTTNQIQGFFDLQEKLTAARAKKETGDSWNVGFMTDYTAEQLRLKDMAIIENNHDYLEGGQGHEQATITTAEDDSTAVGPEKTRVLEIDIWKV